MPVNTVNIYGYLREHFWLVVCHDDDDDTVLIILPTQLTVWFISNQFVYDDFSSPNPAVIVRSDGDSGNSHFVPYPSKI